MRFSTPPIGTANGDVSCCISSAGSKWYRPAGGFTLSPIPCRLSQAVSVE
jgi:hypothetical protein